jgi:hypothetical protein
MVDESLSSRTLHIAGPACWWVGHWYPRKVAGGIYTIPAGKALIVTGATFIDGALNLGGTHGLEIAAGSPANPCTSPLAEAAATDQFVSQNQVFNPGIPVPAGDSIGLITDNDSGAVYVYGYLVPAAAVPQNALRHLPAARLFASKQAPWTAIASASDRLGKWSTRACKALVVPAE